MWNAAESHFMPTKVLRPQWDAHEVCFEGFIWAIIDWRFKPAEQEAWDIAEALDPNTAREMITQSREIRKDWSKRPIFKIVYDDDLFLEQQFVAQGNRFTSTEEVPAETLDLWGIRQAIINWEPIIFEISWDPHSLGRWMHG